MGTIKNIQALRGVAALLVVLEHLKFLRYHFNHADNGAGPFGLHGALGVDIFFIISGYVITLTAVKREHHAGGFLLARLARVCPLYLLFTLLRLAMVRHGTFGSAWNGLFYLPLFDRHEYSTPPLLVGWTLSFEMWFYLAFALLLLLFPPRRVALLLPLLFCLGAAGGGLYQGDWFFPRFMFHPFVVEFALGCLIYLAQDALSRRAGYFLLLFGAAALLFSSLWPLFVVEYPEVLNQGVAMGWERVLIWGLPAALLVAGAAVVERRGGWTFPAWLVGLGTISYSLYLVHTLTPGLIAHGLLTVHCRNTTVASVSMIAASVLLAYACWRWVERPLTLRAQAWVARRYHVPIREAIPAKIAEPVGAV